MFQVYYVKKYGWEQANLLNEQQRRWKIQYKLLQKYSRFARFKSETVNYVIPLKHELYLPNI